MGIRGLASSTDAGASDSPLGRSTAVRGVGLWLLVVFALSMAAAASAPAAETVWLCKPGVAPDPCTRNRTATVVPTSGEPSIQRTRAPKNAPINCFYVYPTVSEQASTNANLDIEANETQIAITQASQFSQDCNVYAPMYPQLTLRALGQVGGLTPETVATAYAGVLAAWNEFLTKYDNGKGVVLLGHSQGAWMLIQLLKEQIDANPTERNLLVSAIALGGNVLVPEGKLVGGDFQNIPACQEAAQTGCVIAYSTFLHEPPDGPGAGALAATFFGRPSSSIFGDPPGSEVMCVNPTLPSQTGAAGPLLPYARKRAFPGFFKRLYGTPPTASTPWVESPGEYSAQCHNENGASWLQVDPVGPAVDPTEYVQELLGPKWGLHLFDFNIALGNLVNTVAAESHAYTLGHAAAQRSG
jgi:Protein of unknown function (DUF3089)